MKSIPTCFFPTTVVLLDDDIDFLDNLENALDTKATYKAFSMPYGALEYIQSMTGKGTYMDTWMTLGYKHMKEDVCDSWKQLYSHERFHQVSTVVIDHMMPGVNGLDICSKIDSPFIQKIMLTGEADQSIAIKAFNEGLIHGFIRKDEPHVFQALDRLIQKRQYNYFITLTQSIADTAKENPYGTVLNEKAFIQIFQDILNTFHIVEFYMIDVVGKFILVDEEGNISALYAYHREELTRMPHMAADGYFAIGSDFRFPTTPVKDFLPKNKYHSVGLIKGQENSPYHEFPIYTLPHHPNYVWGYIPKLVSLKDIHTYKAYKQSL